MPLVSPSRRLNRQPQSNGARLSGWPFTPDSAYIMLSDRLGRGRVDCGALNNRPNDLVPFGALPTTVVTAQGWALQFNGASNYYEAPAFPASITSYPFAIGAVFQFITGATGTAVGIANRSVAGFGGYFTLGVSALGIEGNVRPDLSFASLTLSTAGAYGPLVNGAYYAAALVSTTNQSHHLWFNGIEIPAAFDQGSGVSLTNLQVGGLVRNSTPQILNVSNYPILMAWFGMRDLRIGPQGNAISDLAGAWTRDPWRMWEGSGTLAH